MDDGPLPMLRRFSVGQWLTTEDDVVSHVNISSVQIKDGGQYKCTASNRVGTVLHMGRLDVFGKSIHLR